MTAVSLQRYNALVFDCDGVLLNSNQVKTAAFYKAALPYGKDAANTLVSYHRNHGGISRYVKFEKFLEEMVPSGAAGPSLESLLDSYAKYVREGLSSCSIANDLLCLREYTAGQRWFVASGGDQDELRQVFADRGLRDWFDGGIYGSPDSKDEILQRELSSNRLSTPALFLGDSRYDHQAAESAGLDFVFVSEWSEFDQWPEYCEQHSIPVISKLSDLLPSNKGIS